MEDLGSAGVKVLGLATQLAARPPRTVAAARTGLASADSERPGSGNVYQRDRVSSRPAVLHIERPVSLFVPGIWEPSCFLVDAGH